MTEAISRQEGTFRSDRPWGQFEQFTLNEQTTVKIITVQPGARLSLQRHEHRGEFWQVLDGPMDIQVDDRSWTAQCGEQIWVPQGSTHRMGNSTDQPARILEIAYGTFDEQDIERLEDDYAR
ncbi:phosphomannose isomerase type II C-terminal cupin domain [Lapillicoccus sp.]|uniref:phosphomannose isomerase type II C-terminal cupin domain n=1 Tax=Lapillicoccus sp. TaxID=1909287 RepID=UPI003983731E